MNAISADSRFINMSTTTSTENSGLLKVLLPLFTSETGIEVRVIAVGSGKALKLGEGGDVDAVLAHAPEAESIFVAKGFGIDRRAVMYNDFVIIGPKKNSLSMIKKNDVFSAFKLIAEKQLTFISRGDESGTHMKENVIWKSIGVAPKGEWYIGAGQGMESVIMMANEKQAFTLTDRGTWYAMEPKSSLVILFSDDPYLFNPYHIMAVNPKKHPHVKISEVKQFIDWITNTKGQSAIDNFKVNGKQLFFGNAK
jgi:tungstate transport system substrate-binding protein